MKTTKTLKNQMFIIFFLASFFLCLSGVACADTVLDKGDCVTFGRIQGESIKWRVYDKTKDSVILIADDVISFEAFDSETSLWDTSDLRQWLNSENGFLNSESFTEAELGLLSHYSRNSVANANLIGLSYDGSEEHIYNSSFSNAVQNYSSAYSIRSSDKVFLPGITDVNTISSDPYTFGVDYAMCQSVYSKGEYCSYWLADGMHGLDANLVRCVTVDGKIGYEYAHNGQIGVRPMCSLALSRIGISSGEGSEKSPYILGDDDYLVLSVDNTVLWTGSMVNINVYGKGTENAGVALYHNGQKLSDSAADGVSVEVTDGVNVFNAYVYDASGKPILASSPVTVWGLSYNIVKSKWDCEFDTSNPFESQMDNPNITWSEISGKSGKGMSIVSKPQTQTALNNIAFDKDKTAVLIDVDLRFDTFGVIANSPLRIKIMPSDEFIMPVSVDAAGHLTLNGVTASLGSLVKLSESTWYNFKLVINDENNTVSLAVDNVVLCKDVKLIKEFDYSPYMIISAGWNNTAADNVICVDNLSVQNVEPAERNIQLVHIVHPNRKNVTCIGINNTQDYTKGIMIAAEYDGVMLDECINSSAELNGEGFAVTDFEFGNSIADNGYLKTFLFESAENLRPIAKSNK